MFRKFIRIFDRSLGFLLCRCLYVLKSTLSSCTGTAPVSPVVDLQDVKNILVIKIAGFGDVVIMMPTLQKIRDTFPGAKLYALASPLTEGIFKCTNLVDEIIQVRPRGLGSCITELVRVVTKLKTSNINLVIDFEQHYRLTTVFGFLAGIPYRIGFSRPERRRDLLLTYPVTFADARQNIIFTFADLLHPLGIRYRPDRLLPVHYTSHDKAVIDTMLSREAIPTYDYVVGIHAGGRGGDDTYMYWALDNFAALADRILNTWNAIILLTGSANERKDLEKVMAAMVCKPRCIIVSDITLAQFGYLLTRIHVFITNDTGPMHLGPAMGTPTVTIFGPGESVRYKPFGSNTREIIKPLACHPCVDIAAARVPECNKSVTCIDMITVDEVFAAVEELMPGEHV